MPEEQRLKPPMATSINPPEGTIRYEYGQNHFGLSSITHKEVYDKPGQGGGKFTEGTTLSFNPGDIHVDAKRQEFTAEEINRLGELTKAIYDTSVIDRYLSNVKKAAEATIVGLRPSAWTAPDITRETTTEEIDVKTERVLEKETGITPAYVQEKQEALREKLAALNAEVYELGVLSINRLSGWGYAVTPPKEPTENP